ncbi:MAG TPA: sialidase family protein [Bryobacteraceae bacterium]|nr:exo-alpha-sialidase [Bryobacterales bacterium]HRJ18057.1 sialidase family protein [Bryobacteraceae bacterium]
MKCAMLILLGSALLAAQQTAPVTLFEAGTHGYRGYRIPALVMSSKGTLLAFCAARKELGDWADIDIAMRRSTDGGKTWSPMKIIADRATMTVDNPTPIVDRKTGAIHFVYQVNYAQLFYMRSDDDGLTFSEPVDITDAAHDYRRGWAPEKSDSKYGWSVIAPGPGHGIQLASGRLVVPVWLSPHYRHRPSVTSTIYSDDHGKTWKAGALIPQDTVDPLVNPSEHALLELADGRVMTNLRNEGKERRRGVSISPDGISGWAVPRRDEGLFEAVCMASLVRVGNRFIYASPAALPRNDLTVRVSLDEGRTWAHSRLLLAGPTGYSDMATGSDGAIYVLYEQVDPSSPGGRKQNLVLTRITAEWVMEGGGGRASIY